MERDRAGTLLETDHVHVDTDVVELFIERGFDGGFALVFAQSDRGLEDDWLERKGFERLHGLCVVVREVEESTDGRDSIDLKGIAVEIFHHAARCMCFLGHLVGLLDGCCSLLQLGSGDGGVQHDFGVVGMATTLMLGNHNLITSIKNFTLSATSPVNSMSSSILGGVTTSLALFTMAWTIYGFVVFFNLPPCPQGEAHNFGKIIAIVGIVVLSFTVCIDIHTTTFCH